MPRLQSDIALNDSLEIQFSGGDFRMDESTNRHQQVLLLAAPGQIPFNITDGVDLQSWYQEDAGERALKRKIQEQFTKDGMRINILQVRNIATQDIKINAFYP